MATAEGVKPTPTEAVEQSIKSEVLSLKTRADTMMTVFFADPQKRGSDWGDTEDFTLYRLNLVPENWRRDENQRQIVDRLIHKVDGLVKVKSRARHHTYLTMFTQDYANASLEIKSTRKKAGTVGTVNEFKLGYFLAGVHTGVPIAMKHSLFFACMASEYGNLAMSETDTHRKEVFLQRARFFHQASLFEGRSSGYIPFSGDQTSLPPAIAKKEKTEGAKWNLEEKLEEAELLLTEKVFAAMVEDLVGWEEGVGAIDSGKLQKAFENIRSQFGKLSAGGRFRAKVMENVVSQLGAEGEKMRKANKKDEQIFEEWLKQVFIPLYRRAGKKR